MIEAKHSEQDVVEELWRESSRKVAERRLRENRAAWYDHHERMREIHARLSDEHERKAMELLRDDPGEGGR